MAADVATTLAPDTTMPASVSLRMLMNTSLIWSGGFMRSTGGLTMAWFMNNQVLARMRDAKELVGEGARAGVGRAGQDIFLFGVMQRVIEPGDTARGIAEGRVRGDVLDPLAVDIDLAA